MSSISADQDLGSQQNHLAAQNYDLRISNLARFIHSKVQKTLVNGEHKTLTFIDIGAGNGLFLKFFKEHGYEVTGIELESQLVANMKKDPQLKGINISQGDITQITGDQKYDVVIASDMIEHIEDDQKAINNLWTYVAPGGMLIITVPAHSLLYGKRDVAWGHFRRYDKHILLSKVEKLPGSHVQFMTFWNTLGFFAYFLFEKILQKPINEKMRYSNSPVSLFIKKILDLKLKFEEKIGGTPLGLTLIVGVRKTSD